VANSGLNSAGATGLAGSNQLINNLPDYRHLFTGMGGIAAKVDEDRRGQNAGVF